LLGYRSFKAWSSAGHRHRPGTAGFAVRPGGVGKRSTDVVRCDQARALDRAVLGGTRLERLPDEISADVLARLAAILN